MRIGIYFTPRKEQGGVHQYSAAILEALSKIPGHQYVIISTSEDIPEKFVKSKRFKIIDLATRSREVAIKARDLFSNTLSVLAPGLINLFYRLRLFNFLTPIYKLVQASYIRVIESENLDLVFYPTSSNLSFLANTPAVVTVHDLQHRINPQFKEVSAGGRWEHREYGFINISKKAFRILVDSEIGKEDMIKFYKTPKKKVIPLPYLPPSFLDTSMSIKRAERICKKLLLPDKFIFYPAKFWPHKNHANLIKAIYLLKKGGERINLVLTGSKDADFSNFSEVFSLVKRYDLEKQVKYLGYVDNEAFSAIYKQAIAMVMPTYFGPTNIPVLEAWVMGTPVIYSDIRGCREQLGNAGLLANPDSPRDMADKILKLYRDKKLREKLIALGRKRVGKWKQEDFSRKIDEIIKDFC